MTFVELCRLLNVPYALPGQSHHVTGQFVGVDCPWCSPGSGKFKLGYHVRGRYATCWTCGHKDLTEALSRLSKRPWAEVAPLCKGLYGDKVVATMKAAGKYQPPSVGPLTTNLYGGAIMAQEYLRQRGFDPGALEKTWGVKVTWHAHDLPYRLFIPIHENGEEVSWTTRAIHPDNQPRYVSASPERELRHHKHLLYGLDHVRGAAVVVEGPIDAWRIGPGAVATFGTNFTREQVLLLSKIPVRAVCFDREPQAQRQAKKLCQILSAFPGATYNLEIESGKDPGEASVEEVREIRRQFLGDE